VASKPDSLASASDLKPRSAHMKGDEERADFTW
jgi:hypothetical protein